ncbi:MAG: hypothetical protein B7Z33_10975 [Sphingomonadales bacterium 12-68-11]|nr:MAG: hypothetical protein B7Z33_10975 [Sphingomonadales bacterium 12-68-11]
MTFARIGALALFALAGGCSAQPDTPAAAPQLTFHEVMKDQIDVHADEVWELTNPKLDDRAIIDPRLMSDQEWAELASRADAVQKAATEIAHMDPIVVAKPGVKISDEDIPYGHSAAHVQEAIDKRPQVLRDMAGVLAAHMGDLSKAARAHDPAKASPLIDQLDGVCEDCHLEFWYPDQKALVEKYRDHI